MLIENLDAFKGWLAKTLAPICDADPSALAKYVVALVKKDKPIEDLRNNCLDNLNVFLQDETTKFVNLLFETMQSKSYIPPAEVKAATPVVIPALDLAPQAPAVGDATPAPAETSKKDVDMRRGRRDGRDGAHGGEDRGRNDARGRNDKSGQRGPTSGNRARSRSPPNADGINNERLRSRSPKTAAAGDRRANREREREREREQRDGNRERESMKEREIRDREMPPRHGRVPIREHRDLRQDLDRRQGFNTRPRGGPGGGPGLGGFRGGGREGGREGRTAYKRSRSRSYSPGGRPRSRSFSRSWSRSRSRSPPREKAPPRRRCRDYDEKGYCMAGDLCPYDHGFDPVVVDDVALPTIMSGTNSGASVVKTTVTAGSSAVTSTTTSPSVPAAEGYNPEAPAISLQPPAPAGHIPGIPPQPGVLGAPPIPQAPPGVMMGQRPPFGGPMSGMPPLGPPPGWGRLPPPTGPPPGPPGMIPREMLPPRGPPPPHMAAGMPAAPPGFGNGPFPAGPPGSSMFPPPPTSSASSSNPPIPGVPIEPAVTSAPRQLVSLNADGTSETTDENVETTVKEYDPAAPSTGPVEKGRNVFGPPSQTQQQQAPNRPAGKRSNTKLECKKIPREFCNLTKLLEHFGKFGEVVNIEVNFRGDSESALISFRHPPHAHAAYSNPEPVFNNRFIKIFWHIEGGASGPGQSDSSVTSSTEHRGPRGPLPTRDKLTFKKKGAEEEETTADGEKSKEGTPTAPVKPAKPTADEIRAAQAEMRKTLEAKKNASKMKTELLQKKQELLEKQIKEHKFLIERLEKGNLGKPEKEMLLKTVKVVMASITKLKREVEVATFSAVPASKAALLKKEHLPKNPEEAKKVLLDTELDLISAQGSGDDVTTSELRRRVAELKQEALNAGLLSSVGARGRGGARGAARGRGAAWARGGASYSFMRSGSMMGMGRGGGQTAINRIDRRPKSLLVAGFAAEEKDEVMLHLGAIAQIESHDFDVDAMGKPKLVVSFFDRKAAELVATQGSAYKVGQHPPLILKWHTGPPPTPQASTLPTPPPALVAAERASSICSEGNSTPPVVRKKESSLELAEDEEEEDEEEEEGEDDDDESGDDDDELNVIINKDVVDEEHDESYEFGEAQFGDEDGEVNEDLLLAEEEEEEEDDRERSWRR